MLCFGDMLERRHTITKIYDHIFMVIYVLARGWTKIVSKYGDFSFLFLREYGVLGSHFGSPSGGNSPR